MPVWDASENKPTLTDPGNTGSWRVWEVSVAGSTGLPMSDGTTRSSWAVGDKFYGRGDGKFVAIATATGELEADVSALTAAFTAHIADIDNPHEVTPLQIALSFDTLSRLPTAADKTIYSTAADVWAETALTAFARTLLDDADAATARTTLGLVSGGAGDIWVEKAGDAMTGPLSVAHATNVTTIESVNSGNNSADVFFAQKSHASATGALFAGDHAGSGNLIAVTGPSTSFTVSGNDMILGGDFAIQRMSSNVGRLDSGDDLLWGDNDSALFGDGSDAKIYYDATDMRINPRAVGTGNLQIDGPLKVASGFDATIAEGRLVIVDQADEPAIQLSAYYTGTRGAGINARKARGSEASPTDVAVADFVGILASQAYANGAFRDVGAIRMEVEAVSGSNVQTGYAFRQANSAGTVASRMYFSGAGQLQLTETGSAGGVLIGGDAQWYRKAADVMASPDTVSLDGGLRTVLVTKTTTYTAAATDIVIEATSGTWTLSLPNPAASTFAVYFVVNSGSGVVTVTTVGGTAYVGNSTAVSTALLAGESRIFISNGSHYRIW